MTPTPDPIAEARGKLDEVHELIRLVRLGKAHLLRPGWEAFIDRTIERAQSHLAAAAAERAMVGNLLRTAADTLGGGPGAAGPRRGPAVPTVVTASVGPPPPGPVCAEPCGNERCRLCGGGLSYSHRQKDGNDPDNWWCPQCDTEARR